MNYLIFLLIGLITIIIGIYVIAYPHELTHQTIFKAHGVESRIEFYSPFDSDKPTAATIPEGFCEFECENMRLAQRFTDIVGYNALGEFVAYSLVFLTGIIYLKHTGGKRK